MAPPPFPLCSLQRRLSQAARIPRGEAREATRERAERARGLLELAEQRKQDLVTALPWGAVTAGAVPWMGRCFLREHGPKWDGSYGAGP